MDAKLNDYLFKATSNPSCGEKQCYHWNQGYTYTTICLYCRYTISHMCNFERLVYKIVDSAIQRARPSTSVSIPRETMASSVLTGALKWVATLSGQQLPIIVLEIDVKFSRPQLQQLRLGDVVLMISNANPSEMWGDWFIPGTEPIQSFWKVLDQMCQVWVDSH